MPRPVIPKTRRHPDHALLANLDGTAPPRPRPGRQSLRHDAPERTRSPAIPWHSGTHAIRPPAIPTAQRRTRHTPDAPDAHRHSLPLRSTAQRRTRDTPDAAYRCVSRNVRSKFTSTNPRIPCACHDSQRLARERARAHTRFVAQGHEIQRF